MDDRSQKSGTAFIPAGTFIRQNTVHPTATEFDLGLKLSGLSTFSTHSEYNRRLEYYTYYR